MGAGRVPVGAQGYRGIEAPPRFEGGNEADRLETRSGVAPPLSGDVVGTLTRLDVLAELQAGGHHLHCAGPVVDHGDCSGGSGCLGGGREPLAQDSVGFFLEAVVDGDEHREAALGSSAQLALDVLSRTAEHGRLALPEGFPEPVLGIVEEAIAGGDHHLGGQLGEHLMGFGNERFPFGRFGLLGRDEPLFGHVVDDGVSGPEHVLAIVARVVAARVTNRGHHRRRLGHRQLGELLSEVLLGSRLDPVGIGAEVGGVHVELDDLFLGVAAFQLGCYHRLPQLALDGDLAGAEVLAYDLLGDGRGSLTGSAPNLLDPGPHDGPEVEALVLEVAGVLGGEYGGQHCVGDLIERHRLAVALGQEAEADAVGGEDL